MGFNVREASLVTFEPPDIPLIPPIEDDLTFEEKAELDKMPYDPKKELMINNLLQWTRYKPSQTQKVTSSEKKLPP